MAEAFGMRDTNWRPRERAGRDGSAASAPGGKEGSASIKVIAGIVFRHDDTVRITYRAIDAIKALLAED